ncbi:uncharacterized protein [Antedon mediterranea]|uniref:uncharacterized protein n=1 Tax=Antedon mediterranea TaxID=105859 RepID=UPI003AF5073F
MSQFASSSTDSNDSLFIECQRAVDAIVNLSRANNVPDNDIPDVGLLEDFVFGDQDFDLPVSQSISETGSLSLTDICDNAIEIVQDLSESLIIDHVEYGIGAHTKCLKMRECGEDSDSQESSVIDEPVPVQYGKGANRKRPRIAEEEEVDDNDSDELNLDEVDLSHFCSINRLADRFNQRFNATISDFTVKFFNVDHLSLEVFLPTLYRIFEHVVDNLCINVHVDDMLRIVIQAEGLDTPISIPFGRRAHLTADVIFAAIMKVLQSKTDILINNKFKFNVLHMRMPRGGGYRRNGIDKMINAKSIIKIKNDGNETICCARAIVTGISMLEDKINNVARWNNIRKSYDQQKTAALHLLRDSGVREQACGIEELKKMQSKLPNYQIIVLSKDNLNSVIFSGDYCKKQIYLYHHSNHYDLITTMTGFLKVFYFCDRCFTGYTHKYSHKCQYTCVLCKHHECDPSINVSNLSDFRFIRSSMLHGTGCSP